MPDNQLAKKSPVPSSPLAVLAKKLQEREGSFAEVLAKRIPVAIFKDALVAVYHKLPTLHDCTEETQVRAWRSAALQAQIPGIDVHFIPFRNGKSGQMELVSITDYKDLIRKAMASGKVTDIYAEVVYKDDEFEIIRGTSPQIIHKPNILSKNREDKDIIGVYFVAQLKDSPRPHTDFMTVDEVKKIQARSKAGDKPDGPWRNYFPRMCCKTIVKRGCNQLPRELFPVEFLQQLRAEDEAEFADAKPAEYTVLEPGRHKIGGKKPSSEVEAEPESDTGTGKGQPPSVDDVKHELKTELAKLNPQQSEDALFAIGIESLKDCQDVAKMQELLAKLKG